MRLILAVIVFAASVSAADAQYLSQEPPLGALKEGQHVLVDDGSCGAGKVKEVIGGNHVLVGGTKRIVRTHRCIARK